MLHLRVNTERSLAKKTTGIKGAKLSHRHHLGPVFRLGVKYDSILNVLCDPFMSMTT